MVRSHPKMNGQASAPRFFFTIALGRADLAHQVGRLDAEDVVTYVRYRIKADPAGADPAGAEAALVA